MLLTCRNKEPVIEGRNEYIQEPKEDVLNDVHAEKPSIPTLKKHSRTIYAPTKSWDIKIIERILFSYIFVITFY